MLLLRQKSNEPRGGQAAPPVAGRFVLFACYTAERGEADIEREQTEM
jgi:hypothetical protein